MSRALACRFLLSALAASSVLTGCGGAARPAPAQTFSVCAAQPAAAAVLVPPQLVYPLNGATNVPDGNFTLVLSTTNIAPQGAVSLAIDNAIVLLNVAPTAIPSPLPSPAASAPPGSAYAIPALNAATTYQVIDSIPQTGCFTTPPPIYPGVIGSFTTR